MKHGIMLDSSSTIDQDNIESLNLSVRAYSNLTKEGIYTVSELREKSKEDLLKISGIGYECLKDICSKLIKRGIILKDN